MQKIDGGEGLVKKLLLILWNGLFSLTGRLADLFFLVKDFFYKLFTKAPKVMSKEESINHILKSGCSVCRLGDGEIKLIAGRDISFQKACPELSEKFGSLMACEDERLLVCIPDAFSTLQDFESADGLYWKKHLARYRPAWYKYAGADKTYGNAFISRPYMCFKEKEKAPFYFDLLKKLWKGRQLVIIEGEKTRFGVGNDLLEGAAGIERILGPSSQAFTHYDQLLDCAKKSDKSKLIIIALGPVASLLAFELAALGCQALDLGNLDTEYEWYLRACTEKQPIKGKLVYEAGGDTGVGPCLDKNYESQIIAKIF